MFGLRDVPNDGSEPGPDSPPWSGGRVRRRGWGGGSEVDCPRAPGKWSPSQVVEHVARIMEESANVASGDPSKFPKVARLLRPLARLLFFQRVLRRNSFLTLRTAPPFDPATGSPTPGQGRIRVEQALARFDKACQGREASGAEVASTIFGDVSVADFARFQELHVRHHLPQLAESG